MEMFGRCGICLLRVSILTFSTIFLLDCGGNVQTGWYLFASVYLTFLIFLLEWYHGICFVSILPFSTIFLLDCV